MTPITEARIDQIAKPFIRQLGGDHWSRVEDGISESSIEDFVRAIEAEASQNWIPVSTPPMQPDANAGFETICCLVTDGATVSTCDFARGSVPKPWAAWSMYGGIPAGRITHWMPMPKPPAKEMT